MAAGSVAAQSGDTAKPADASAFVYADFDNIGTGQPVSKGGGVTRLNRYAQNMANAPKMMGFENSDPPAPAGARVTDNNTAAAFRYELRQPNEWAGVNMEVFGHPAQDGKLVGDDVTGYKLISMQIMAKGPKSIRIELISRGLGYDLEGGYPAVTFRLKEGFAIYKLKLDSFRQPEWARHIDFKKDVLAKLTSVTVGVFCEGGCTPENGMVVVDNIMFEK
jgi:hypothetical protein